MMRPDRRCSQRLDVGRPGVNSYSLFVIALLLKTFASSGHRSCRSPLGVIAMATKQFNAQRKAILER